MDILIKNMEMPKNYPYRLTLHSDGHVEDHTGYSGHGHYQAIELPPHEHLTEKSAFWNMLHEICVKCNDSGDIDRYPNRCIWCKIKEAYEKVYQTPTILEASENGSDN